MQKHFRGILKSLILKASGENCTRDLRFACVPNHSFIHLSFIQHLYESDALAAVLQRQKYLLTIIRKCDGSTVSLIVLLWFVRVLGSDCRAYVFFLFYP